MRVAHLIHHLNPFGTERVVLALLKYRGAGFQDQFVVSTKNGALSSELRATGCEVFIETKPQRMVELLGRADLINAHCLYVERGREMVEVMRPTGKPYLFTLHWPTPFPPDMAPLYSCTSLVAYRAQHPQSHVELIENGIDLASFPCPAPRPAGKRFVITRVCRPEKNDEYLWPAMADVLARYPQVDLRIVGSTTKCEGRVQSLGVRHDIATVLQDTDLFVYTPRPGEGTKDLVVMEAMAMGLPCVLTDVATARASSVQGRTAVLVPFRNTEALTAAIETLITDEPLRRRMGAAARDYAAEHFDVRDRIRRYEAMYSRLLVGDYGKVSPAPRPRGLGALLTRFAGPARHAAAASGPLR